MPDSGESNKSKCDPMGRLPSLKATELAKILIKMGFEQPRKQSGSHIFFRHPDRRTTVIPNHPTENLDRRLLNKIIKHDLQITRQEFEKYL